MSFIKTSVVLLFIITIVSCVSFKPKGRLSTEVPANTELGKNKKFSNLISSTVFHRVRLNKTDGVQVKVRVKKTSDRMVEATKLHPMRLIGLTFLLFRNMFSNKPVYGDPSLRRRPDIAVAPFVKMAKHRTQEIKENVGHKESLNTKTFIFGLS